MFEFIKKAIFAGLTILSRGNPLSAAPLSVAPLNHNKKNVSKYDHIYQATSY